MQRKPQPTHGPGSSASRKFFRQALLFTDNPKAERWVCPPKNIGQFLALKGPSSGPILRHDGCTAAFSAGHVRATLGSLKFRATCGTYLMRPQKGSPPQRGMSLEGFWSSMRNSGSASVGAPRCVEAVRHATAKDHLKDTIETRVYGAQSPTHAYRTSKKGKTWQFLSHPPVTSFGWQIGASDLLQAVDSTIPMIPSDLSQESGDQWWEIGPSVFFLG